MTVGMLHITAGILGAMLLGVWVATWRDHYGK